MKKEEIILVRIMSVIGMSLLMALVLFVFAGGALFENIVKDISTKPDLVEYTDAAIYNIYFYKGLDVVYKILFSVTLYGLVLTAAAMFMKQKGAGYFALISSSLAAVTGLYIILCKVFEQNKGLYRFINGFYLDDIGEVYPVNLLGAKWIAGVLLLVLGILTFFMIKSGRIDKIKAYGGSSSKYLGAFIPAVFAGVFYEFIREVLFAWTAEHGTLYTSTVYLCLKDYYFADTWFFNWTYALFLVLTVVGVMFLNSDKMPVTLPFKMSWGTVIPLLLLAVGVIRGIVFLLNPPALFGALTTDEALCDAIERAYPMYIVMFILDMAFLMIICKQSLEEKLSSIKILTVCGITMTVSIIGILAAGHFMGLAAMYISCIIADIIGLICCLYTGNIRRSHH